MSCVITFPLLVHVESVRGWAATPEDEESLIWGE